MTDGPAAAIHHSGFHCELAGLQGDDAAWADKMDRQLCRTLVNIPGIGVDSELRRKSNLSPFAKKISYSVKCWRLISIAEDRYFEEAVFIPIS